MLGPKKHLMNASDEGANRERQPSMSHNDSSSAVNESGFPTLMDGNPSCRSFSTILHLCFHGDLKHFGRVKLDREVFEKAPVLEDRWRTHCRRSPQDFADNL